DAVEGGEGRLQPGADAPTLHRQATQRPTQPELVGERPGVRMLDERVHEASIALDGGLWAREAPRGERGRADAGGGGHARVQAFDVAARAGELARAARVRRSEAECRRGLVCVEAAEPGCDGRRAEHAERARDMEAAVARER